MFILWLLLCDSARFSLSAATWEEEFLCGSGAARERWTHSITACLFTQLPFSLLCPVPATRRVPRYDFHQLAKGRSPVMDYQSLVDC